MLLCFFLIKQYMNSYYYPSRTSHNSHLSFLSVYFCITEPVWEIVLCCGLILYSVCVCECVFVCVPVRELEIEPCNKHCAFPDRIAETLTSSTAALPKKRRLVLLKMRSFSRGIF